MSELGGLIERVEKATGPDRELDVAIQVAAVGPGVYPVLPGGQRAKAPFFPLGDGSDGFVTNLVPSYTSSIDIALALVERVLPEASYAVNGGAHVVPGCSLWPDIDTVAIDAHAATPVLAICLALLRALLQREKQS